MAVGGAYVGKPWPTEPILPVYINTLPTSDLYLGTLS